MASFEVSCYFCNQVNITVLHKQTSSFCYEFLWIYYDGNSSLFICMVIPWPIIPDFWYIEGRVWAVVHNLISSPITLTFPSYWETSNSPLTVVALCQPSRAASIGSDLPKGRQLCWLGVRHAVELLGDAPVHVLGSVPSPGCMSCQLCPAEARQGVMQGPAVGKRKTLPYLKGDNLSRFSWDRKAWMKHQIMVQHL